MMFNFSIAGENIWKGVETRPVPPCLMPIGNGGGGLAITDNEPLEPVAYAVKHGMWLSVQVIQSIFRARAWPLPPTQTVKAAKSGRAYQTRKRPAWVKSLIENLFPDATDQEKARLIAMQSGVKESAGDPDVDGDCDDGILEVIAGLDPENAIDAKGVRRECFERLLLEKSQLRASGSHPEAKSKPEPSSGWKKEHFTPPELKSLLPPTKQTVYIRRLPGQTSYAGFYDRSLPTS